MNFYFSSNNYCSSANLIGYTRYISFFCFYHSIFMFFSCCMWCLSSFSLGFLFYDVGFITIFSKLYEIIMFQYPQIILPAAQKPSSNSEAISSSSANCISGNITVSQTQTPPPSSMPSVSSNGPQLGLITVTSNIQSTGSNAAVNPLGSTAGTLLGG